MSHTVVAELVAAVMKVEVELGQEVAADDAVVILESMKMEIPVLADVAGSVSEIVVSVVPALWPTAHGHGDSIRSGRIRGPRRGG